jgi:hypothetical protein
MIDFMRIYLAICGLLILNGLVQLLRGGVKIANAQAAKQARAQARAKSQALKQARADAAAAKRENQVRQDAAAQLAQTAQALKDASAQPPRKRGCTRKHPEAAKPTPMPPARTLQPAPAFVAGATLAPEVYTLAQLGALIGNAAKTFQEVKP